MLAAYTMWHRIIHIICDNVELSQLFSFIFLFLVQVYLKQVDQVHKKILYAVLLMQYSHGMNHTIDIPRIIETHSFPGENFHCFLTGFGCFSFVCLLLISIRALCCGLHMWDMVM